MRKTITLFMAAVTLFAVAALFASCSSSNPLVGTWEYVGNGWSDRLIVNSDGTGRFEEWEGNTRVGYDNFTWSSEDGIVTYVIDGRTFVEAYSVRGRILTFWGDEWTRR